MPKDIQLAQQIHGKKNSNLFKIVKIGYWLLNVFFGGDVIFG